MRQIQSPNGQRTDVETFLVQDEGATYRYRTRTDVATDTGDPDEVAVLTGNGNG